MIVLRFLIALPVVVKMLLLARFMDLMGISYLKLRTKDGATVFHLAAARGHDHILEYLLANRNSKLVRSMKDITGSTPAHDASENGISINQFKLFLHCKHA